MDYKAMAMELVDLYGYRALFVTMFLDTLGIPMPWGTSKGWPGIIHFTWRQVGRQLFYCLSGR